MNYKLIPLLLVVLFVATSSSESQYLFPPENYKHWQKLEKVCEVGRKTYGANEFLENGKICRWAIVPYWATDRVAWDAARAAEKKVEK
jgi:hypothetical protein